MASKQKSTGFAKSARFANTLILLVALVAVIILVNVLSLYVFGRADLTENNINSLSPQSIVSLQALTETEGAAPLEVRVYISGTLPDVIKGEWGQEQIIRGVAQKFRDKLEEYQSHVEGRMEIVEVTADTEKLAEEAGLSPFVAEEGTVKEGKFEMTRYVLGCTFHWEGEVETYERATDPAFFEFEITKRLLRLKDRVENGRKIQHLTKAAEELTEAVKACDAEVHAFEMKEEEKQEVTGIEGLLKPIENMEEEAEALAKNREVIAEKCAAVKEIHDTKAAQFEGHNRRFDSMLRGDGPDERVGGVLAYIKTLEQFDQVLAAEKRNVQQVMRLKGLLNAVKEDIVSYNDMLRRSPGERKIGFLCGHDEFCPFPNEKMPIDPQMAQMMGQQNPIHQRFLQVAMGIQDQVNQVLMGIGNGLFRQRDFEVEKVDATKTIREEIAALIIFGAKEKISERERYEIDQYLMRGGTVLVLAQNFDVSLASFSEEAVKKMGPFNPNPRISNDYYNISKTSSNVDDVLAPYGVQLNADLVIDASDNNKVTLPHSVRRGQMVIRGTKDFNYPMLVYAKEFDRTNAVVRNLPGLTLPFVSTMEFTALEGQEVEVSHLVTSGPQAVALTDPTTLAVRKTTNEEGAEVDEMLKLLPPELMEQAKALAPNGPHTLGLMVTGTFVSAFKGKEEPAKPPVEPPKEGEPEPKEEKAPPRLDSGSGRLLVLGSSLGLPSLTLEGVFKDVSVQSITQGEVMIPQVRFENWKVKVNQFRRAFGETIPALFNVLDWAVQRSALAEIRGKSNMFRALSQIDENKQKLVSYGAVAGLPFLFLLFGVGYWQLRLVRRRKLSRKK